MKVLLIGGTGLISTGIIKHLARRNADLWMLNRGQRENTLPAEAHTRTLLGDRNDPAVLKEAASHHFDAVIDMCCYLPEQCQSALGAFAGKTKQFIFCSTVNVYGIDTPPGVFVDETHPYAPTSVYASNKVACEKLVTAAAEKKHFATTIIRPASTYGPGSSLIDQLEFDPVAWHRLEIGKPVLIADSGQGLWVSTHRDDCGQAFAYAVLNEKTFNGSYNATRDTHLTWRDYYHHIARALNAPAPTLIPMPAGWIWKHDEKRFRLLKEVTAYTAAYTSAKAKRDMPEYRPTIDLTPGAAETFEDQKRRNAWKPSDNDPLYDSMIQKALSIGIDPLP